MKTVVYVTVKMCHEASQSTNKSITDMKPSKRSFIEPDGGCSNSHLTLLLLNMSCLECDLRLYNYYLTFFLHL